MARKAVLNFFDAPSEEYTVIFTSNASSALKLVGEAFPFSHGGSYVLGEDAHNSIHGIRRYASAAGASVHYIPATSTGGFDERTAEVSTSAFSHLARADGMAVRTS
jgi:molybdenum cofactor sulfurtransferase